MSHISDRAAAFAKKFVKPKPEEQHPDDKLVEFYKKHAPSMRDMHRRVQKLRGR